jgi:RsiW-degrading membrane proteinase PrsW (M82 family)
VPQAQEQPQFALPEQFRYKPRRAWLESKGLRLGALITLLALCGVTILAMVQRQTGTEGFAIGFVLAVLPVPLVLGAFLWVDRVNPEPPGNLVFAFAWGACAATLVAIIANSWTTDLLISHQGQAGGEAVGAGLVAPLVEETSKGAAVLLLFLFRRKDFDGIVDGVVYAGFTAAGFAFTENILYIGRSVLEANADGLGVGVTVFTFLLREVISPFAHPLFTSMTGVGFGIAATTRKPALRVLAPLGGWVCAMIMHGTWNGASTFGIVGFLAVYLIFMIPVFCLMVWLVTWARRAELKVIAKQLPVYAWAGWITAPEPLVLSSMRTRRQARDLARYTQGPPGDRSMREYQGFATSLAFLREKAERGQTDADFAEHEQELLHHLWERKDRLAEVFAQVGAREWYRTHAAWGPRGPAPAPYGAAPGMPYNAPIPGQPYYGGGRQQHYGGYGPQPGGYGGYAAAPGYGAPGSAQHPAYPAPQYPGRQSPYPASQNPASPYPRPQNPAPPYGAEQYPAPEPPGRQIPQQGPGSTPPPNGHPGHTGQQGQPGHHAG